MIDLDIIAPHTSAVGCIRVSTDQQNDAHGPDRQRQEIEREAARAGLMLVHWIEESVSGADHDRATANDYYVLARRHKSLNFIFSHPNRLGRHVEISVAIARQLHALDATVWVAGLGSLRDRRHWSYFLRDAADAETDYHTIVHQLGTGKRSKASKGLWSHGAVPWGYVLQRDHRGRSTVPVPDPDAAPVIRRIYELAETMGETRIQHILNAEGLPSPSGRRWSRASIKQFLRNERYTGKASYQGITISFEPIIAREWYDRVQQARGLRRRIPGPRDETLLWAGHVRCTACESAIGRDVHTTPYGHYAYYRCWRSRRSASMRDAGQVPCSHRHNHDVARADAEWWAYLSAHLVSPELLAEIVAPPPVPQTAPPADRLMELQTAIARAWEPYTAGNIPKVVAEQLAAPYVVELQRLEAAYAAVVVPESPDLKGLSDRFARALQGTIAHEDKRALLRLLSVQLYVGPEGPTRLEVTIP